MFRKKPGSVKKIHSVYPKKDLTNHIKGHRNSRMSMGVQSPTILSFLKDLAFHSLTGIKNPA